jgi:hypothetical protein
MNSASDITKPDSALILFALNSPIMPRIIPIGGNKNINQISKPIKKEPGLLISTTQTKKLTSAIYKE